MAETRRRETKRGSVRAAHRARPEGRAVTVVFEIDHSHDLPASVHLASFSGQRKPQFGISAARAGAPSLRCGRGRCVLLSLEIGLRDEIACRVAVFDLEVERQRRAWPDKASRLTCWCTVEEAMARASDPGLKRLIAKFAKEISQREP
jgi:hypothetical protein